MARCCLMGMDHSKYRVTHLFCSSTVSLSAFWGHACAPLFLRRVSCLRPVLFMRRGAIFFPHCPCMLACIAMFDHACTLSMATPPFQSFAPLHIRMHLFGLGNSFFGVPSTNHYLCDDVYNAWSTKWAKRKLTKTSFARRDGAAGGPRGKGGGKAGAPMLDLANAMRENLIATEPM